MKQTISFSGGKDSTAMLHMMLDKGEQIDEVIFFDTGWEFPQMIDHLRLVAHKTGLQITHLKPKETFSYWMFEKPIKSKKDRPKEGIKKGEVHRIGNGWPSKPRRWCTREKCNTIERHLKHFNTKDITQCIGFAADELHRLKSENQKKSKYSKRYPLIEYGINEAVALEYCKKLGYDWGGLYDIFPRVSCYCCPLQSLDELRKLRKHFPHLWDNMLRMDDMRPEHNKGFIKYDTVHDLDRRFNFEDKLQTLGVPTKLRNRWSCKFRDIA